jgi:SAM-dependent methyltransferase
MQITKRSWRAPLAIGWALRRTRELLDPWLRDGGPAAQPSALPVPWRRGSAAARTALALVPWLRGRSGPAAAAAGALVPPRRLRARAGAAGAYAFMEGGRQAAAELSSLLAAAGRAPERPRSVLDFGCGAGRVLPHVVALAPGSAGAGCDVDAAAIDWAVEHHPDLAWSLSSFQPPLPYPPDSFDLIYSISVFSHLDRELTGLWLDELARVLAPDGIALLSVHGSHAFERFRHQEVATSWCAPSTFQRGPLRPDEFVFAPYARSFWNQGELPGIGRQYGLSFHGSEHARRSFGRSLQVVEVRERALTDWQDVAVCLKC